VGKGRSVGQSRSSEHRAFIETLRSASNGTVSPKDVKRAAVAELKRLNSRRVDNILQSRR